MMDKSTLQREDSTEIDGPSNAINLKSNMNMNQISGKYKPQLFTLSIYILSIYDVCKSMHNLCMTYL